MKYLVFLSFFITSCVSTVPKNYSDNVKAKKEVTLITPFVLINRFGVTRFYELENPVSNRLPDSLDDDISDADSGNVINTPIECSIIGGIKQECVSYLSGYCKVIDKKILAPEQFATFKDIDKMFYELRQAPYPEKVIIGPELSKQISMSETNEIIVIKYWGFARDARGFSAKEVIAALLPRAMSNITGLNDPFGSNVEIAFIDKTSKHVVLYDHNIIRDLNPINSGTIETHVTTLLNNLRPQSY